MTTNPRKFKTAALSAALRSDSHALSRELREIIADRLDNQVIEIKSLQSNIGAYIHLAVWRGQIIRDATRYLKENQPVNAMAALKDRVEDGGKVLRELAEQDDEDETT